MLSVISVQEENPGMGVALSILRAVRVDSLRIPTHLLVSHMEAVMIALLSAAAVVAEVAL
jgi:hypothetical protein